MAEEPARRPNFIWITAEDSSKHYYEPFDPNGSPTPNIASLAEEGVLFTRAFSCAPVCSAARSVLATGAYGPRIGTQFHRKLKAPPLPEGLRPFHRYLKDAGYYCPHPGKLDYNFSTPNTGGWDPAWDQRPEGQPFFLVHNFNPTHENVIHYRHIETGPFDGAESVFIPPIHPDTPLFRNSYAKIHGVVRAFDQWIGRFLKQIEHAGLLEETFIFVFGDHGGTLPGSKGYLYETGLHIPLVVRIPENFRHGIDLDPGTASAGFVSFADFGPTVLHLAGLPVPEQMDGRPFMGPGVSGSELAQRDETFGAADRFDEKYDLVRTLRKGRFKYMRSYQPFNFDALQNNYRYFSQAFTEWRNLYREGKLNDVQSAFFRPRPPEALFDIEADPYETKNLAGDPEHAATLAALRGRLTEWVKGLPDLSFYPESVLVNEAMDNPVAYGQEHKADIARMVDIADLQLVPFDDARAGIATALASTNVWDRYWGLIVCSSHGRAASEFVDTARELSAPDIEPLLRVRAAEFLGLVAAEDPRPILMDVLAAGEDPVETVLALNTVVLLQDGEPGYPFDLSKSDIKVLNMGLRNDTIRMIEWRLMYLASDGHVEPPSRK